MVTFIGEIVAMPTTRKAVKDKDGKVIAHEVRHRFTIEPRDADDDGLVAHLLEIIGESVKVSIVLEQPGLPK